MTVLKYTFQTLGNLKYLLVKNIITNKDNTTNIFGGIIFKITNIPIAILNNMQNI